MPTEAATPGPTPILETISCAAADARRSPSCATRTPRSGPSYVDEITDEQLVDGAVRGMIEYGLEDPYSGYLPPEPVR